MIPDDHDKHSQDLAERQLYAADDYATAVGAVIRQWVRPTAIE